LDALVAKIPEAQVIGDAAVEVGSLAYDSRKVGSGTLFFLRAG
jgi:UDP-N-acetylmuramyl pentapeptide synthase